MTEIVNIEADNQAAAGFLNPYLQSGNLNFLFGAGASYPAINTAGSIEAEINSLLGAGKESEADTKCLEFIAQIEGARAKAALWMTSPARKVAANYVKFLSIVDRILFARKSVLLPRQANIFTTNYDMFFENAASKSPVVTLNDGFDRSSSV